MGLVALTPLGIFLDPESNLCPPAGAGGFLSTVREALLKIARMPLHPKTASHVRGGDGRPPLFLITVPTGEAASCPLDCEMSGLDPSPGPLSS